MTGETSRKKTDRLSKAVYQDIRDAATQILVECGIAEAIISDVISRLDEHVHEVFGLVV